MPRFPSCPDRLAVALWTREYHVTSFAWFLVVSPLLSWASGEPFAWRDWFRWPVGNDD